MPGWPVNEKAAEISYHNWALEHDSISQSALRELSQQFVYYKSLRMKKPTWKVMTTLFPESEEQINWWLSMRKAALQKTAQCSTWIHTHISSYSFNGTAVFFSIWPGSLLLFFSRKNKKMDASPKKEAGLHCCGCRTFWCVFVGGGKDEWNVVCEIIFWLMLKLHENKAWKAVKWFNL